MKLDCRTISLRHAAEEDRDFAFAVKKAAFREYVEKVWAWDETEQRTLHSFRIF